MMSKSVHSLARRGVEAIHTIATSSSDQGDSHQVSPVAALVFILTCLAFIVIIFGISYTYGQLIPILCMIESPETNVYVPVETIISAEEPPAYSEEDDGVPKPADSEVLLVKNKPFTSSIRQTILHLRARAGYWSRFRGLGIFLVWGFLRNILIQIFTIGSRRIVVIATAAIAAEVALAHIHMTWIHVVISEPSEKRWYRRIPSLRGNWVKIAPAVFLWSFTSHVVHVLPMLACGSFGVIKQIQDPNFQPGKKDIYISASQLFMGLLMTIILSVALEIPATVALVRVAASMLPEEDETIVPFDRSFGGKVTPAIIGGQGKIGIVEAWRTFPWESRKRLLLLCAKVVAIVITVWLLFSFVIVAEAHLMFGPEGLKDMMRAINGVGRPH